MPSKIKPVKPVKLGASTDAPTSTPAYQPNFLTIKIAPPTVRVPSNDGRSVAFLPVLPQRSRTYS